MKYLKALAPFMLATLAVVLIALWQTAFAAETEELWKDGPVIPHTNYLRIGTIIGSDHLGDGEWNEEHNGLYIGYKGWAIGQYENSYSEQDGYGKLKSSFITYEVPLHREEWVETSFTLGVVTDYPKEATTFRRSTIPWVTFNIRFGRSVGVKLWHVPTAVTAYGLEYRHNLNGE